MKNSIEKAIRVLIVEDEAPNSRMLRELIAELRPQWKVEAITESVQESVAWLQSNPAPDIILMDIQLSDGICFSIFDQVALPPSCRIIFTTAYDEYAIRAFKVNSIDYLLKPIEKTELEAAIKKYEELLSEFQSGRSEIFQVQEKYDQLVKNILSGKKEYRTRFLVAGVNNWQTIETKTIAFIFSENKLTFAVDFEGRNYTLDYTLEQLESELNPAEFYRANRKTILHIDAVIKVYNDLGGKLKVVTRPAPDFEIPVSRLKATDFKIWMGK
ncbi:MAG: response regulator transcription factor [Bacteroidales bacterium]|nr:response regulator transcription factor [Bacteroidales bacterium]MDD4175822.1 response regulator transcription factor [Bacteroidales bacterium]